MLKKLLGPVFVASLFSLIHLSSPARADDKAAALADADPNLQALKAKAQAQARKAIEARPANVTRPTEKELTALALRELKYSLFPRRHNAEKQPAPKKLRPKATKLSPAARTAMIAKAKSTTSSKRSRKAAARAANPRDLNPVFVSDYVDFSSSSYPASTPNYTNNLNAVEVARFTGPSNTTYMSIEFDNMNLEPNYDYIKIYGVVNGSKQYCQTLTGKGPNNDDSSFESSYCPGSTLIVEATTDGSDSGDVYDGFTISGYNQATGAPNSPPIAAATANGLSFNVNVTEKLDNVIFDGRGSTDPDGNIVSYDWDFDDGDIDSGSTVTHTFQDPGTYHVSLTVTDSDGDYDTDVITINVSAIPLPVAALTLDRTLLRLGDSNPLHADGKLSTNASYEEINWGDGSNVEFKNGRSAVANFTFTHIYSQKGVYSVQLYVENEDGYADTQTRSVTVRDVPHLSNLVPNHGPFGTLVTINGTDFFPGDQIQYDGSTFLPNAGGTSTQLQFNIPQNAHTNPVTVVATIDGNPYPSLAATFTVDPFISGLNPNAAPEGQLIQINGLNFVSNAVVKLGSTTLSAAFVNSQQFTFIVPAGATSANITVTLPPPSGAVSNPVAFSVRPKINTISPTSGLSGTTVTVTGTSFIVGQTQIFFNGAGTPIQGVNVQVSDSHTLTVVVPPNAESGPLYAVNPSPSGASALSNQIFQLPIQITGISGPPTNTPIAIPKAWEGSTVTVNGKNFLGIDNNSGVTLNGQPITIATNNGNQITLTVKPAPQTPLGQGHVTLTNALGSVNSTDILITVPPVTFAVNPYNPPSGWMTDNEGLGRLITITGSRFTNDISNVTFSGGAEVPPADIVVLNSTQLQVHVPAGALDGPISITNPATRVSGPSFHVTDRPPQIDSFTPTEEELNTITITGKHFSAPLSVTFTSASGPKAGQIAASSDTQMMVIVPFGALDGPITVNNGSGVPTATATNFIVKYGIPFVSAIEDFETTVDNLPAASEGKTITLVGSKLLHVSLVKFGGPTGVPASPISISADGTSLKVKIPDGAFSGPIYVETPPGFGGNNGADGPSLIVLTKKPMGAIVYTPHKGLLGTMITVTGKLRRNQDPNTSVANLNSVHKVSFSGKYVMFVPYTASNGKTRLKRVVTPFLIEDELGTYYDIISADELHITVPNDQAEIRYNVSNKGKLLSNRITITIENSGGIKKINFMATPPKI